MGYEFENIESQIVRVFALDKAKGLDDVESKKILDLVSLECERATKTFKRLVLSAQDEGYIRRYFHFHQESLTRLIDKTERPEKREAVLVSTLRKFLLELLDALRDQFPGYFNCDTRMPGFLQRSAITEMTESADSLRSKFTPTALDLVLIDIVLEGFNLHEPVSYQKVDYLRHLKERLAVVDISLNDPDLLRQDLCKMLINCNYNAREFFDYYTRAVKKTLINCETLSDRIDLVSWYLKECSQEQCLHKISFDTERLPIHIQLGEWLAQELDYYKQKQQLLLSPGLQVDGPEKDFKLNFDLSVSQLAFLFKALIETGVIRNKNISQLIRFLVKFVKTKKSESVSYESFRMRFYNPESGTKDAVKKVLGSLLQYISKN